MINFWLALIALGLVLTVIGLVLGFLGLYGNRQEG